MTTPAPIDPAIICETILEEGKAYNIGHTILPSENTVADRLLVRRLELTDAYAELHEKLDPHPSALQVFLDLLLSTAAFWNPEANAEARDARERLEGLNEEIAEKAADLARLLDKRTDLHNSSGFYSSTHYHPLNLVEQAAADNYLYKSHIKKPLAALRGQYDLKYWPSISECLVVLSRDAEGAVVQASDPLTEAATRGQRKSLSDFVRALFASIEENSFRNHGFLTRSFRLSDASLASLVNCALDLGPDKIVDAAYIKRLRQRERTAVEA
jgi:hypothetical protein